MISPRQRLRLDSEVPVLFSLPNLRTRGSKPAAVTSYAASPAPATEVPAANLARLEPASPLTAVSSQPVMTSHQAVLTNNQAVMTSNQAVMTSSQPVAAEAKPVTAKRSEPTSQAPRRSDGRSWMERVGSRLILVVTLLVIVTAAWITGQRMPASKPDAWDQAEQAQAEQPQADAASTAATVAPTAPAAPEPWTAVASLAAISKPTATSREAAPSAITARQQSDQLVESDPLSATDSTSMFNTVSLQSVAPSGEQPADSDDKDFLPLAPPLTSTPAADIVQRASNPVAAPSDAPQTDTPHAPVIDPAVLLPWLNEQTSTHQHRTSATPNAIADWTKYLPMSPPDKGAVRAVSSNEVSGQGSATQQAIMPPGVVSNPYSQ